MFAAHRTAVRASYREAASQIASSARAGAVGLGQRERNALVLADRPVEDHALVRRRRRLCRIAARADAERLRGDEDAFGVEAVEQVAEALALLADPVGDRHGQVVVSRPHTTRQRCGRPWGSGGCRPPAAADRRAGASCRRCGACTPRAASCARAAAPSGSRAPSSSRPCGRARCSGRRRAPLGW